MERVLNDPALIAPRLFGLAWAKIKIPMPKGVIKLSIKKGERAQVYVPDGVTYTLEE